MNVNDIGKGILMVVEIIVNGSCIGCGQCRKVCPKGPRIWHKHIKKDTTSVYVAEDPGSCLFCKMCVGVCPVNAITVSNR